ncbi:hypothetical protein [Parapedobacter sp. DT-150]|uniref:hypothetical protein n=1 Tax=Parapedobacter sp. DT-150 TaxID=3396162 RepID=UPI003F1A5DD9
MNQKSKLELEIVANIVAERILRKKPQSYIAMLLDVTDGYIGQVESHKSPSMLSHDQINEIAKDFECSPRIFYPDKPIDQELPKRKKITSEKREKQKLIIKRVYKLFASNFFKQEKSVEDIISKLKSYAEFSKLDLTNKDVTDCLRSFKRENFIDSRKEGNKNYYSIPLAR